MINVEIDEKQEIGLVTLQYSESGEVLSAVFNSTEYKGDDNFLKQLNDLRGNEDEKEVKIKSELVLSAWFNRIWDFELADRNKFRIEGEVVDCKKYPSGKIEECKMQFYLTKLKINETKSN